MSTSNHAVFRRRAAAGFVGALVLVGLTPAPGNADAGTAPSVSSVPVVATAPAAPRAPSIASGADKDARVLASDDAVPPGTVPGDRAIELAPPSVSPGLAALTAKQKRKVLVIPVYWSGVGKDKQTTTSLTSAMKKVDTFYRTVSSGRVGLTTKVLGWSKIAKPSVRCGLESQMDHVAAKGIAAAKKKGVNPSSYAHVIFYVTAKACGGSYGGAAGLGSMPGRYVWLNGTADMQVVDHELGHNFGLDHANYLECSRGSARVVVGKPSACQVFEYDDQTDSMGNAPGAGWFSGPKLARLKWLTSSQLRSNVKASSASYTLHPMASSSRSTKVVKIKATSTRTYWVEYRRRTGVDKDLEPSVTGVQVRVTDSRLGLAGNAVSAVLDMYPYDDGTSWWGDGANVALPTGSSWTSPEGIRVTVRKASSSSASVTVQRHVHKATKPAAVPSVVATNTDGALDLQWKRAKDGGMPVLGYRLTATSTTTGKVTTQVVHSSGGTASKATFGGLRNGQRYTVRVVALNEVGTGSPRSASVAVAAIHPTIKDLTPVSGATLEGPFKVSLTPLLGKGSKAKLEELTVCVGASWCQYLSSYDGLRSGKRVSLTFDPADDPWSVPPDGSAKLTVSLRDSKPRSVEVKRSVKLLDAPTVTVDVPAEMTDQAAMIVTVTPRRGMPQEPERVEVSATTTYEHPDGGEATVWTYPSWTSGNTWTGLWDQSQVYPASTAATVAATVDIWVTTPYRTETLHLTRSTTVSVPSWSP